MPSNDNIGFCIDADISVAQTPPSALYHDPAWFKAITERVLRRSWHLFPGAVPAAVGDQVPWNLLEGSLAVLRELAGDDGADNYFVFAASLVVRGASSPQLSMDRSHCETHKKCGGFSGK